MSVEDKIRRAEEIYYRRKNQEIPFRDIAKQPAKKKKNIKLLKKMIKQIIICLLIYSIFYAIVNNNYVFSEDFTKKAREILSQDINFSEIYSNLLNVLESNTSETKNQPSEKTKDEIQNNDENIGGAEELPTIEEQNVETVQTEETVLSQMEQDAKYIKNTINFIKPVDG